MTMRQWCAHYYSVDWYEFERDLIKEYTACSYCMHGVVSALECSLLVYIATMKVIQSNWTEISSYRKNNNNYDQIWRLQSSLKASYSLLADHIKGFMEHDISSTQLILIPGCGIIPTNYRQSLKHHHCPWTYIPFIVVLNSNVVN